jgi:hypothetical protein
MIDGQSSHVSLRRGDQGKLLARSDRIPSRRMQVEARSSSGVTAKAPQDRRALAAVSALAGPLLIVAAVLVVMRPYAFTDRISTEDLLRYWLPMYNFLGKSLRAGHIPGWNPYVIGGTPFASDPQSGWMQVLPMLMFTALPIRLGIRWLVVIQPMLAGVGLFAFLRSEGTSRAAATVGGLALALVVSASRLPLSVRFPGVLAWTTLSLAACSRYLRSDRWSRRILWALLTALAWGQVAASHLTVGLILGTGALLVFLVAKAATRMRSGNWTGRMALGLGGVVVLSLPLVNLAYLMPRLALGPRTSVSLGYSRLHDLSLQLTGRASPPFPGLAADVKWPLNLATFPGRYMGAAVLLSVFAGLWSRRYRYLVAGFALYGALCYALGLKAVAYHVPRSLWSISLVDQYLHHPYWLSFGVLLAIGVMGGIGVEAWRERRRWRDRVLMILPAVGLWLFLPIGFGARVTDLLLLAMAGAITVAILVVALARPGAFAVLPALLVAEVIVTAVLGSSRLPFKGELNLLQDLDPPTADVTDYLTPTALSRVLAEHSGERYYTVAHPPGRVYFDRRALQNDESMVTEVENVGGYQAVQLKRYWLFVRRLQHVPMKYQYALFVDPPPVVSNHHDLGWVIAPASQSVGPDLRPVADDGGWTLYRYPRPAPRATVISSWSVVRSPDEALQAVVRGGFDPNRSAILEHDPGMTSGGAPAEGTASYRALGPQSAQIEVIAPHPSIVVIRNMWDGNWQATVDGRLASVMATDYVVQGVPVQGGHHTIVLTYNDPTIGYGMLGSGLAISALLVGAWLVGRREGRANAGKGIATAGGGGPMSSGYDEGQMPP